MDKEGMLKLFEQSVVRTRTYAWWLYWVGLSLMIGSVIGITFKIMQTIEVWGLKGLSKGNKMSNDTLEKQFSEILDQY